MIVDHAMLAGLSRTAARYRAGEFSAAEYAAYYVLVWQLARHDRRFALRRSRRDPKPDAAAWCARVEQAPAGGRVALLADFLERHDLRGVRRRVNIALIGW